MKNGENCSREVRKIFILVDFLLIYVYMYMRYGVIKVLNIFFLESLLIMVIKCLKRFYFFFKL